MELKELQEHLRLHALWIVHDTAGERADLSGANLSEADLSGANLYRANLSGADLSGANLSGANLYEADLSRANLSRADLSRADLSEADLSEANLSGADLSRANLYGTLLENKVILSFQYKKHTAYYYGDEFIHIGCHKKTIEEWLKTYNEVGLLEKYSEIEISKYGKFIKGCANIYNETKAE